MPSRTELCFAVGLPAISFATEAASSGGRFVADHCQLGAGIGDRFGT
jgi:hypothetical protein